RELLRGGQLGAERRGAAEGKEEARARLSARAHACLRPQPAGDASVVALGRGASAAGLQGPATLGGGFRAADGEGVQRDRQAREGNPEGALCVIGVCPCFSGARSRSPSIQRSRSPSSCPSRPAAAPTSRRAL